MRLTHVRVYTVPAPATALIMMLRVGVAGLAPWRLVLVAYAWNAAAALESVE